MLSRLLFVLSVVAATLAPASARSLHGSAPFVGVGTGQLNFSLGDFTAQAFTSINRTGAYSFSGGATPAALDAYNFPIANFTGSIVLSPGFGPAVGTTGPFTLGFDGGRSCFQVLFNQTLTIQGTPSHVTVVPIGGTTRLIGDGSGQAGSVTYTIPSAGGSMGYSYDGNYTNWNCSTNTGGRFYIARSGNVGWNGQSDLTAYLNGIDWTLEAAQFVKYLGTESLRFMGGNVQLGGNVTTNVANWKYRYTTDVINWSATAYPPGTRCGSAASGPQTFCTIAVSNGALTALPATDTPLSGWTADEQITGNIASTTTGMQVISSVGGASVVAGGTGGVSGTAVYQVVGGVGTPAQLNVTVSGGAITTVNSVASPGSYTTFPLLTSGLTYVSGVGSGVTGATAVLSALGVTSNGGNCQFTVASTTPLVTGNPYFIEGILGATECNNQSTILSVDSATQFTGGVAKINTFTGGTPFVSYETLTITGKTGGAKVIANSAGGPIGSLSGDTLAAGNSAFTYNALLDRVIYGSGGITNSIPIEAQTQFANLVGSNYWYNFPGLASDDFDIHAASVVCNTLNAQYKPIFENDNEQWNGSFKNAQIYGRIGTKLGINGTTGSTLPFQSLRNRLIFGNLIPVSTCDLSRVDRTYGIQGGFGPGFTFATAPIQGSSLVSPGTAAYQAYVTPYIPNPGITGYGFNTTVASGGNGRPGDYLQTISHAPYLGGGTAFSSASVDAPAVPKIYDAPLLNAVLAAQNASNFTTVYSLMDGEIRGDTGNRVTTFTTSGTVFTTPSPHNYSQGDTIRCSTTGGTGNPGINPHVGYPSLYQVLAANFTTTTFSLGEVTGATTGAAITPGAAGTGTTTCGDLGPGGTNQTYNALTIFTMANTWFYKYQQMATTGFSPPLAGGVPGIRWYEGAIEITAPTAAQLGAISVIDVPVSITSLSGNTICMSSMPFVANEQIAFTNVGSITGVAINTGYFAVSISGNCAGVATTSGGTALTLGGTTSGTEIVGSTTAAALHLSAAVTGYQFSQNLGVTFQYYHQSAVGLAPNLITTSAMPNAVGTAQLVLNGGGLYALNSNSAYFYTAPTPPLPRSTYKGFCLFSNPAGAGAC